VLTVFILGSQIKKTPKGLVAFAEHTALKAEAAVCFYNEIMKGGCQFVIMGGHNFGVRYDNKKIMESADFSFEALALAQNEISEAQAIKEYMISNGVSAEDIFIEELSATTEEQVQIVEILLKRTTFKGTDVSIFSVAPHLHRSILSFQKICRIANPLYAEDVLRWSGKQKTVVKYYKGLGKRNPKAVNFSLEELKKNLGTTKGIATLFHDLVLKDSNWTDNYGWEYSKEVCACSICGAEKFISGIVYIPESGHSYSLNEDGTTGDYIL